MASSRPFTRCVPRPVEGLRERDGWSQKPQADHQLRIKRLLNQVWGGTFQQFSFWPCHPRRACLRQVPEFIQLTEEIGDWAGDLKQAKLPDYFEVDHVRVGDAVK